ncbi:hypothetical protein ACG7TL_005973 [Trametes sanguinea]
MPSQDVVFRTASENAPNYVVKAFDLNTEELQIYERLLGDLKRPANHTPPSEILRSTQPFLIMPVLSELTTYVLTDTSLRFGLRVFYELIQGVEYLHDLHIAHLDIYPGNAMVALPYDATFHKSLVPDRIYIIDFDTARQFSLGPGVQPAIILPETQPHPPNGLTHFDPYSWDVYCLGRMFEFATPRKDFNLLGLPVDMLNGWSVMSADVRRPAAAALGRKLLVGY